MRIFLCEKPSQARDIARELGQARDLKTYLEVGDDIVAFARGHLYELANPEDYDPAWEKWRLETLPIVPERFKLRKKQGTADLIRTIGGFLKRADEVVIATDADREGEMIAREILDEHRYTGRVRRLWLRALDPESIRKGLAAMQDGRTTEPLYHSARARSRADWLVGMNMSRAATVVERASGRAEGVVSVGRVQTPTLALVVRRDREIDNFRSRDYFQVVAVVRSGGAEFILRYAPDDTDRLYEKKDAELIAAAASDAEGPLRVVNERKKTAPPKLYSLSALQGAASAKWGWSAEKTLQIAQALYERHKLTTYPRTDCNYLPEEQAEDVPIILQMLKRGVMAHLPSWEPLIRKAVFDSAKITAHHAIVPTKQQYGTIALSDDEALLYKLICASYAAATMADYEYDTLTVELDAASVVFSARGNTPVKLGWKSAFGGVEAEDDGSAAVKLPALLDGAIGRILSCEVETKKTKPPARFTEGTLIEAMKSISRYVTDPAQKKRLREMSGIGTEATRAAILKVLRDRDYVVPQGKFLVSTAKGRALITWVEEKVPNLADPGETAEWEDALAGIEMGVESLENFIVRVSERVGDWVKVMGGRIIEDAVTAREINVKCPRSGLPARETDYAYVFPGVAGIQFQKEFCGRKMSAEEWAQVLDGKGTELNGFYSKARKRRFAATLRWNESEQRAIFVFERGQEMPAKTIELVCPKSNEQVQDKGTYYFFPGYPGLKAWKEVLGRAMRAEEYAQVLQGNSPVFKGFRGKRVFNAGLVFNEAACKMEFNFEL